MAQTTYSTTDLQGVTLSGGNLTATSANATTSNYVLGVNADGKASGKYYIEWLPNVVVGGNTAVGFVRLDAVRTSIGPSGNSAAGLYYKGGLVYVNGVGVLNLGITIVAGTYVYGAIDFDNKRVWFKKAGGNWNNTAGADPATNSGGIDISAMVTPVTPIVPVTTLGASADSFTMNTGATAYNGTPPAGFGTWDTAVVAPPTYAVFSQAGTETWENNSGQVLFSQVGAEAWTSIATAPTTANFSQVGIEAWTSIAAIPTYANFSQVGVEVWHSISPPPPPPLPARAMVLA